MAMHGGLLSTAVKPGVLARGYRPKIIKLSTLCQAVDDVLKDNAPTKGVEVPAGLNKFSKRITQPKSQGASQAMLYGTGMTPDDMNKPQV